MKRSRCRPDRKWVKSRPAAKLLDLPFLPADEGSIGDAGRVKARCFLDVDARSETELFEGHMRSSPCGSSGHWLLVRSRDRRQRRSGIALAQLLRVSAGEELGVDPLPAHRHSRVVSLSAEVLHLTGKVNHRRRQPEVR